MSGFNFDKLTISVTYQIIERERSQSDKSLVKKRFSLPVTSGERRELFRTSDGCLYGRGASGWSLADITFIINRGLPHSMYFDELFL